MFHVGEDAIVRHEGNLKPDRCRSHPTVRLMLLLAKAVPGPDTPCAERGICLNQVWSRPDDLRPGYLVLQPHYQLGKRSGYGCRGADLASQAVPSDRG